MIIPIATNLGQFNLKAIREIAHTLLNQDLSTSIKDERSELIVLAKLRHDCDDQSAVAHSRGMSKHFHYTFLIPATEAVSIDLTAENDVECTVIPVNEKGNLLILSGTLKQFIQMIISLSVSSIEDDTLTIANELQEFFERIKLGYLFSSYQKKRSGNCFILERKKD